MWLSSNLGETTAGGGGSLHCSKQWSCNANLRAVAFNRPQSLWQENYITGRWISTSLNMRVSVTMCVSVLCVCACREGSNSWKREEREAAKLAPSPDPDNSHLPLYSPHLTQIYIQTGTNASSISCDQAYITDASVWTRWIKAPSADMHGIIRSPAHTHTHTYSP